MRGTFLFYIKIEILLYKYSFSSYLFNLNFIHTMASFQSPDHNHMQHTALELLSICYDEPTTPIQESRSPSYTTPIHSPIRVNPPNAPRRNRAHSITLEYDMFDTIVGENVLTPEKKSLVPCVESPCISTECPICMETLKQTDVFTTRCGHMYHGTCMIRHIKNNDSCPMCRGVLFQ